MRSIVGRNEVIDEVVYKLMAGETSRILIHGIKYVYTAECHFTFFCSKTFITFRVLGLNMYVLNIGIAGVGKDTVAAAVVNDPKVKNEIGGLQGWLQASSEALLQQQLVDLFVTHRPWTVRGIQNDRAKCLAEIAKWLAQSDDWILVFEDASPTSKTLREILPKDKGRVLVTSQAPLHANKEETDGKESSGIHLKEFIPIELETFSLKDSIALLMKRGAFKIANGDPPLDDATLEAECVLLDVPFDPFVPSEKDLTKLTENQKTKEQKKVDADSEKRRRNMTELLKPAFQNFLEEELGNLPLSVSMVAHIARSDESIKNASDLINIFEEETVGSMWEKNFNKNDKHVFGLKKSVQITLNRMDSNEDISFKERREARALLCALSRLDRTKVPTSLLIGHQAKEFPEGKCWPTFCFYMFFSSI